jgi:hypothetical protein
MIPAVCGALVRGFFTAYAVLVACDPVCYRGVIVAPVGDWTCGSWLGGWPVCVGRARGITRPQYAGATAVNWTG